MANIEFSEQAPGGSQTGARILRRVAAAARFIVTYMQHQQEHRMLLGFDERTLRDMGTSRYDVTRRMNLSMRDYQDRYLR